MSKYIITGNLGSQQNISSISSWLADYCPLLRNADPEMELTVAGKNPAIQILDAASKAGARVVPWPKDMTALLEDADIYVCPADNGGGIKLRMMDGLKHGLPVVAHSLAARGYEQFVGKSVFLYDDAPSFLAAVDLARKACLDKESLIRQYKETFSFDAGVRRLREILET